MADMTIQMKVLTHGCGLVYTVPLWLLWCECPACAGRKLNDLQNSNRNLNRTIIAMRGALTKAKRRV